MNKKKPIISGHHGMYSFMPSLCPHEISQLGGIDDNHELPQGAQKQYN